MRAAVLHSWITPINIAYLPGDLTPALRDCIEALFDWLRAAGCRVTPEPDQDTDLIVTTALFGQVVTRDEALLFHAKRMYRLGHRPKLLTIVDVPETEYQGWVRHFAELARQPVAVQQQEQFPGLGPQAAEVIAHQIERGGPDLAFSRLVQAQVLSIRVLALRTEGGRPYRAMHFDLAGARPVTDATDLDAFAADAGARVLAAVCANEVNQHVFLDDAVPAELWDSLAGPDAMVQAGHLFTQYGFFTTPIQIEKMLGYRGLSDAISAQYSEGCYAVFEPNLPGLITTATGSSRLVDKRAITRADQAVVVGTRPGGLGAIVRPVDGREQVVPSVEAVEMMGICEAAGTHTRRNRRGETVTVPNVRALLHGHLGVAAFDPEHVEAVSLSPLFYTQLVSCGTGALAQGTAAAFAASEALRNLDDPRRVVFLEQPGHGVMVVEKWHAESDGQAAFDTIRAYLEAGHLQMTFDVPQGAVEWETSTGPDGRRLTRKAEALERMY